MRRNNRNPRRKGRNGSAKRRQNRDSTALNAVSDIKMPQPMMAPANRTYIMQFRNVVPMITSAGGVVNSYISFDPSSVTQVTFGSGTQFTEWSSVASLFNTVRIRQFEMQLCRTYLDDTKGDDYQPLVYSSVRTGILANPGSYQAVIDNGDSQMYSILTDVSGRNHYAAVKIRQVAWATVTTPNPGSSNGIIAGCPGGFVFYGTGYPNSSQIGFVKIVGTYQFKTRV